MSDQSQLRHRLSRRRLCGSSPGGETVALRQRSRESRIYGRFTYCQSCCYVGSRFAKGDLPRSRGPALGCSPANIGPAATEPQDFWVPLGPSKGTTITGLGPCPTKVTTLSKPAGRGPWRWNAASEAGGLGVGNAGTFAHLGGEGGGLLLKGAKVGKTPFASLAGWAKDGTVALVSTSKLAEFSRAIEIPAQ